MVGKERESSLIVPRQTDKASRVSPVEMKRLQTLFKELQPVAEEVDAALPVSESYNWGPTLSKMLAGGHPYLTVVEFHSMLKADADPQEVIEHDTAAEEEAKDSDGYIGYNKGPIKSPGLLTVSFCGWIDNESARLGSMGPAHMAAMALASEVYDYFEFTKSEARMHRREPVFTTVYNNVFIAPKRIA